MANVLTAQPSRVTIFPMEHRNNELQRLLERERKAKSICSQLNNFIELDDTLSFVVHALKELTSCQAISVRLHDDGDYPYFVSEGFPESFLRRESSLCSKDQAGKRVPEPDGQGFLLDCMCGNIIKGRFDQSLPFFTDKGSFFSNNTSALLANTTPEERQGRTRNYCNSCGYESVALIPIIAKQEILGLLQLNDKRIGLFSNELIEYLEMIGEQIGLAVQNSQTYSKLKQTEESLQEALQLSESRFRNSFEAAAHGMALVSLDGDWLKVNKAFCKITGYSEQEFLQTNFQSITHPDDLEDNQKNRESLLSGQIQIYQTEKRYLHKKGKPIWVHLSVTLVRDTLGQPLYFVSQAQDINERKRHEIERQTYQEILEQRISERTAALAEAYEKIHNFAQHQQKVKEDERQTMAREIHDELGQSLTGLKLGLAWLDRKIDPQQTDLKKKIASLTDQAGTTIDTVRKITRELRPGLLDDLGLVAALEWQTNEFSKRFDTPCEIYLDIGDFQLNSEAGLALFRICQEGLTNVSRHAQASKVAITMSRNDLSVDMKISDNGVGIDQQQVAAPKSFGLLGMRERLFPLEGSLKIKGKRGKGTTVAVSIPIERARRTDDPNSGN